jgi:hypothetical protein
MRAGIAFGKTADALRYDSGANRAAIDRACRSGPDCPTLTTGVSAANRRGTKTGDLHTVHAVLLKVLAES